MIVSFPVLYEDELLYSWFARYKLRSGYFYNKTISNQLRFTKKMMTSAGITTSIISISSTQHEISEKIMLVIWLADALRTQRAW